MGLNSLNNDVVMYVILILLKNEYEYDAVRGMK